MHSKSFVAVMTSWGSRVGLARFSGVAIIIRPCLIWWFLWRCRNYCVVATGPRWSPIYSTAESLYLCGASAVYGKTRPFTRSQFGPLTKVLKSESQFCDKRVLFALLFLPSSCFLKPTETSTVPWSHFHLAVAMSDRRSLIGDSPK